MSCRRLGPLCPDSRCTDPPTEPQRLVVAAQRFVATGLHPGDWALDATVGNGHDTLLLARCVGAQGRVYGFDIQQQALDVARQRLIQAGQATQTLLIHADHARLAEYLPPRSDARFKGMMMNLGYLPGGNRAIRTRTDRTLRALGTMLKYLAARGRMTVLAYRGHAGGAEEADAVRDWASALNDRGLRVHFLAPAPGRRLAPLLTCIENPAAPTGQTPARPDTVLSLNEATEDRSVKQHLERVEQLLRKYGHVYQANLAMLARQVAERDPGRALAQLDSDEWWGDADSVAAIDLAINGGFSPQARGDANALRRDLTDLYQMMVDEGIRNDKGEIMTAQFRKWLASHM